MFNRVILIGKIGRPPALSLSESGQKGVEFFLGTSLFWKDKFGEGQSETDWHRISVFRKSTIGWVKNTLKRGDTVYVEGRLIYEKWADKHSQVRLLPHIVISGPEGQIKLLESGAHEQNFSFKNSEPYGQQQRSLQPINVRRKSC